MNPEREPGTVGGGVGGPTKEFREVVGHPLRGEISDFLSDRRTGSPSEIAKGLGVKVEDVAYHARRLSEIGAIELVDEVPVHGSIRHTYRVAGRAEMTPEEFGSLSPTERAGAAKLIAQLVADEMAAARGAGMQGQHATHSVSRLGGPVDDRAVRELLEIQKDARQRVEDVLAKSRGRVQESDGDARQRVRVVSMVLGRPDRSPALE